MTTSDDHVKMLAVKLLAWLRGEAEAAAGPCGYRNAADLEFLFNVWSLITDAFRPYGAKDFSLGHDGATAYREVEHNLKIARLLAIEES